MSTPLEESLAAIVGDPARVSTVGQVVNRLSRDFYWYSPVLRKQLDGKIADVVVHPLTVKEIQNVLGYCYAHEIPVTARGAGTGNYGQAVPLHGGVLLDLSRMDEIESITSDGVAVCQPGVRLGVLEGEARKLGWELRCYPSTVVKASVGGFLGGGSGGIGSVTHGAISRPCAPSTWSPWKTRPGSSIMKEKLFTRSCTRGGRTASLPACGWR
jgi:FAD/FMN-containing dehydrogenase